MQQESSRLASLPQEVFDVVTQSLSPTEFSALRLTCRLLESKTVHTWGPHCFNTKAFMITTPSLDALDSIAKHPVLSKSLQKLVIRADYIAQPRRWGRGSRGRSGWVHEEDNMSDEDWRTWLVAHRDQEWLLSTRSWILQLAIALRSMPNLTTLALNDGGRFVDSAPTDWDQLAAIKPCGWSKFPTGAGAVHRSSRYWPDLDSLFQGFLAAIAQSGITPPTVRLEFQFTAATGSAAVQLPPAQLSQLRPFFANVTELFFTIHTVPRDLLSLLPNLRRVGLRGKDRRHGCSRADDRVEADFFRWLLDDIEDAPVGLPPPATLPRLKALFLCDCKVPVQQLAFLVDKFKLLSLQVE